jgi:hypothetical protein
LPFASNLYETVVSVSTIEHVGCDNAYYTGTHEAGDPRLDDFTVAVRELRRVVKAGGLLMFTVPYGRYQFHGSFQQFDRQRLTAAEAALGPGVLIEETFFRYSRAGWQRAADSECEDCEYVAWVSELMRNREWPAHVQLEPDFAAAARAIACVTARFP